MSVGLDPGTFGYLKEKLRSLDKKWAIPGALVLFLIIAGLGSSAVLRPVIVLDTDETGIFVKNAGGGDALIHKVDGFWYWAGRVAFIANMPGVHQRVESGAGSVRLEIPDIPIPENHTTQQKPFYMKLAVRYRIPGMPIFRYTEPLFFEYDSDLKAWATTESIPVKYRSLGNLTVGNVEQIELSFH
ncbi:MAG: hypothetical protein JRF69_09495 [Deltaproteobacteria bacterium]|nr:hypothetical protein [Deltaproteobacteria bacterium]